jgi:hypothetical protein
MRPNTVVSVNGVLAIVDTLQGSCYRLEFADGSQMLCTRRTFTIERRKQSAVDYWMSRCTHINIAKDKREHTSRRVARRLVPKPRMVRVYSPRIPTKLEVIPACSVRSSNPTLGEGLAWLHYIIGTNGSPTHAAP